MAIWDVPNETMDREALASLQLERLKATVGRCYESVPLYRSRLDAAGIVPADIRSLDDLRRLPFTTKDDFRDNYPFGLFAVPRSPPWCASTRRPARPASRWSAATRGRTWRCGAS